MFPHTSGVSSGTGGSASFFPIACTSSPSTHSERIASAFELLGSTFLDEHHDSQKALHNWRMACDLRQRCCLPKPKVPPKRQYGFQMEFQDRSELESLSLDLDSLRVQSLLICERILGTSHKDMIYRLMYRGAAYADSLQFQHCIELWKYALELRVAKDSILFCDTCFTAQALVKLYLDLHKKSTVGLAVAEVHVEDVVNTLDILLSDLPSSSQMLSVFPRFRRQQDSYDKILRIITHLLHLVEVLPSSDDESKTAVKRRLHQVRKK